VKVLSGVYHHRIDYPQTRHLTRSQAAPVAPVAQPQAAAQLPAAQPEVAEPKAAQPKAPEAPEPDPIDLFTDVDGAEPEGDGADDRGDNA